MDPVRGADRKGGGKAVPGYSTTVDGVYYELLKKAFGPAVEVRIRDEDGPLKTYLRVALTSVRRRMVTSVAVMRASHATVAHPWIYIDL